LHRFNTDHECDRQTDGQTPRRSLRRAMHSAIACKNCLHVNKLYLWVHNRQR